MSEAVKSAVRVLEIFEHFAETRAPASVMEVSKALGFPQSSTSALLKSLVALGYMDYDANARSYLPNLRLALLSTWLEKGAYRDEALIRRLERIRDLSGETVVLGLRNGMHAQYVVILEAERPIRLHMKMGTLRPLTRTGIGRALLMSESDAEIRGIVRRINAETPEYRVDEQGFLDLMAQVRVNGFAETAGDMTPGAGMVAVPLANPPGGTPMAVGIGGPLERLDASRRIDLLAILTQILGLDEKPVAVRNAADNWQTGERNHA
jgi:DNA-binding IclR family transcriptional regulator